MADKSNRLRQLYSSDGVGTDSMSRSNNETYLKRLESDIKMLKGYLKEADLAAPLINKQINHESINEKKRIIALYQASGKLPYIPSKDEVIQISTTSQNLAERSKELERMLNNDQLHITLQQVEQQRSNKQLYESLKEITENIKNKSVDKFTDLSKRIEQEEHFSTSKVENNITKMIKESNEIQKSLNSYLKKVITRQVEISASGNLSELDLKESIKGSIKLITQLLDSNSSSWVEVAPSTEYDSLLKLLVLNNLIRVRDDSTPERFYVKIRDFGVM